MATRKNLPLNDNRQHRLTLGIAGTESGSSVSDPPDPKVYQQAEYPQDPSPDAEQELIQLSIGQKLRQERERQGLSLHDVAETLRLRPRQVQAIEDGDHESLPGQAFVTGFLRSYANVLGLDAVSIVELYKQENAGQLGKPQLAFPEPTPEGRLPGIILIIVTSLIAAIAFSIWYFYLEGNKLSVDLVPELPERLLARIGDGEAEQKTLPPAGKDDPSVTTTSEIQVRPTVEDTPVSPSSAPEDRSDGPADTDEQRPSEVGSPVEAQSDSDGPSVTIVPAVPRPAAEQAQSPAEESAGPAATLPERDAGSADEQSTLPESEPAETASSPPAESTLPAESEAPVATEAAPEVTYPQATLDTQDTEPAAEGTDEAPQALGVQNSTARIVIVARLETWVQITAGEADVVLDRVLRAGDTFMIPPQQAARLTTANAGALEIRLDGETLGAVGKYGDIVRDMALDPENLRDQLSRQ